MKTRCEEIFSKGREGCCYCSDENGLRHCLHSNIIFFFEMEESHVFQASHVIHTQGWLWTFNPPDFLNGWVTSLPHLRKFDTVLRTKPRTSCILDKHSGSWAIPSVPNPVMSEAWYVKCSTYQVPIEYSRFSNWNRNGKVRIVFPITKIKVEL